MTSQPDEWPRREAPVVTSYRRTVNQEIVVRQPPFVPFAPWSVLWPSLSVATNALCCSRCRGYGLTRRVKENHVRYNCVKFQLPR